MLRLISFGICIIVLAGCGLFRKVEKSASSEDYKSTARFSSIERQDVITKSHEQNLLITTDSANVELKTVIWPLGKFKYSLDSGFVGEAEKVEQVSVGIRLVKTQRVNQKLVDVLANVERGLTKDESTSKVAKGKTETSTPTTWSVVLIFFCSVFFLLIYGLYRKYHFA